MSENSNQHLTRRDLLKVAGGVAAAAALAEWAIPHVHAAENNTIQVALVGCGGRGTGAAANALQVKNGPIKLVAMADVFPDRLDGSYKSLAKGELEKQVDVPKDRQFIGFDAYRKAMDCLKPGDIVILTTPPAFRWVQFAYAIQKGLHVFMEKPTTVDGPSTVKMLNLAKEADKKNLKVGVGLMCRHCDARGELYKRIRDGAVGELMFLRAVRMQGPEATCFSPPKPKDKKELEALVNKGLLKRDYLALPGETMTDLEYQIRQFHSFLWASGGCYSDFLIHNIDECCWMKDAWPVKALATGGRHSRSHRGVEQIDQNFDHYMVEYTFADGARLLLEGRTMPDCAQEFSSTAFGTKGSCVISQKGHTPCHARTYKGWKFVKDDLTWEWGKPEDEPNPYQLEWDHLIEAIRSDKPYNEAKRGAMASLVTAMGRIAAHTGQIVTFDEKHPSLLSVEHDLGPDVDKLVLGGPAPIQADKDGRYPVPEPGRKKTREF